MNNVKKVIADVNNLPKRKFESVVMHMIGMIVCMMFIVFPWFADKPSSVNIAVATVLGITGALYQASRISDIIRDYKWTQACSKQAEDHYKSLTDLREYKDGSVSFRTHDGFIFDMDKDGYAFKTTLGEVARKNISIDEWNDACVKYLPNEEKY
jgi:hypothetical protein